jgi:hypothetical protein
MTAACGGSHAATSTPGGAHATSSSQAAGQPTGADASPADGTAADPSATTDPSAPAGDSSPSPNPNAAASVLPTNRIVSFYGHPNSDQMGVLGEYSIDDLWAKLQEQGAAYQTADPSHPVTLAFELIASVAQGDPGNDGTYLDHTSDEIIQKYVDFATAHNAIVILDVQIGWSTVKDEVERLRPWLEKPNVHLAIDPEFSTGPDRVPGTVIGEVDGSRIQYAVEMLSQLVQQDGLPDKVLIVHQFEEDMITNKDLIHTMPGVDIVLDMDGFGDQGAKLQNYTLFVHDQLIQYGGIKLFYKQDDPLLTPEQIVALDPPPLVVIYQ